MKKVVLLFLLSVAVYGDFAREIREECLDGNNIETCKALYVVFATQCWKGIANITICKEMSNVIIKKCLNGTTEACESLATFASGFSELPKWLNLNCKDYMKAMRKGCNLGGGLCCALLGDEFHSISVNRYGSWKPKYGINCSLRNQNEAFKYYKKACELGGNAGCQRYTELQNDLDEIDRRERDKTYKGDITIRQK